MKQVVLIEKPPIFEAAAKVFDIRDKPILFAWGDWIYNPMNVTIPPHLYAHERVHGDRQGSDEAGIHAWWHQYLHDPRFRFEEERLAHRAEFMALVKRHSSKRALYLERTAERLAAPLYGRLATVDQAREALQRAA